MVRVGVRAGVGVGVGVRVRARVRVRVRVRRRVRVTGSGRIARVAIPRGLRYSRGRGAVGVGPGVVGTPIVVRHA